MSGHQVGKNSGGGRCGSSYELDGDNMEGADDQRVLERPCIPTGGRF